MSVRTRHVDGGLEDQKEGQRVNILKSSTITRETHDGEREPTARPRSTTLRWHHWRRGTVNRLRNAEDSPASPFIWKWSWPADIRREIITSLELVWVGEITCNSFQPLPCLKTTEDANTSKRVKLLVPILSLKQTLLSKRKWTVNSDTRH